MNDAASRVPPAVFLMGPTAAGKTDLAVDLVERLPCEIISVDSAMIYRGMNIGTAKPDASVLARAPHCLIDICDPAEAYSAAQFRSDALHEMARITAQGRVPLLVGGTMLYFRVLQQGLSALPAAEPALRVRLATEAALMGAQHMHARLAAVDPAAARRIHPNDPQRVQRALEVYELAGRSLTELCQMPVATPADLPYRVLKLIVAPHDRQVLHRRIETRFRRMLDNGFLTEVAQLHARHDLNRALPSLRTIGYRQAFTYLDGEVSYAAMVQSVITASRQLAKRQLTWLRQQPDGINFDALDPGLGAQVSAMCRRHLD